MESMLEKSALRPFLPSEQHKQFTSSEKLNCYLQVSSVEATAAALLCLWQELKLGPPPLIFLGSRYTRRHRQHQTLLLDKIVERGQRRRRSRFGQIDRWELLEPPTYAHSIAQVPLTGPLLKADLFREASVYDRKTVPGPVTGWFRYDFSAGWTGLSVMLAPDSENDVMTITAVPDGCQDEWLAFLESLRDLHNGILHRKRKGQIEVLGDTDEMGEGIKKTTFADVILPEEVLEQVASQRRIFSLDLLGRYASFGIPRMRKVLLVGPPGTGKTTLLKAEATYHVQNGGHVFYVFAAKKAGHSWELLSHALSSAAVSKLPTLILVEDFEQFVSDTEDLQRVLNTLDGIATPDNPAGTLLLATSNAPEKIDPRIKDRPGRIDMLIEIGPIEREDLVIRFLKRFLGMAYFKDEHAPLAVEFLKQTGSHIREICLLGAIHSLEENRTMILREDLLWAHGTILNGRGCCCSTRTICSTTS